MIVIVLGPDAALARAAMHEQARRHDPENQATSRLDGRTAPLKEIIAQASSPGFFGAGRVVIVDDLLARAMKGNRAGAESSGEDSGASSLDISPLFAATPPTNVVILADPGLASLPAAIKKIVPSDATVITCDPPRGGALVAWLQRRATAEGGELDPGAARFIAERVYPQSWGTKPNNPRFDVPPDLDRLATEIAKLAVAADPGPITRSLVEQLVASGDQDQIFRFADAAARGAVPTALMELHKLLEAGEEPFAMIAQLNQQAELATVLETAGSAKDPVAIGRDLGLSNPGRMSAIAASRRGQPPGAARRGLESSLAVDRQIKRGRLRDPQDGLYALVALGGRLEPGTRKGGR